MNLIMDKIKQLKTIKEKKKQLREDCVFCVIFKIVYMCFRNNL